MLAKILLLLLFLNKYYCRDFWSPDLPEVSPENLHTAKNYTALQIRGLNSTLDLATLINLRELKLFENQLQEIPPGTLCSPKLQILELDFTRNSNPLQLTQEVFKNCNSLEELLLNFNNKASKVNIDQNALQNLNLRKLCIQNWSFGKLEKDFLVLNNVTLSQLVFGYCEMSSIDSDAFINLRNLEDLQILHSPNLRKLPKGLFQATPKLRRLNLRDNALTNLTFDEFEGLSKLEDLVLFDNNLEQFDANKIREYMPKLKKIETAVNPTPCKYQKTFADDLKKKYDHFIEISILDFC